MGFGIMFLGYFLGFIMPLGSPAILRLLGCAIIGIAAYKLRDYCKRFNILLLGCVLVGVFYGGFTILDILAYLNIFHISETVTSTLMYVGIFLTFVFNVSMLIPIREISKETQTEKLVFGATRNIVFHVIFVLLIFITLLPYDVAKNMLVLAIITYFVIWVFDLVLVFRCYAQICDENDLDMAQKPSRFAFVNKFREESERRRQEVAAERAAMREKKERQRKKRRR